MCSGLCINDLSALTSHKWQNGSHVLLYNPRHLTSAAAAAHHHHGGSSCHHNRALNRLSDSTTILRTKQAGDVNARAHVHSLLLFRGLESSVLIKETAR